MGGRYSISLWSCDANKVALCRLEKGSEEARRIFGTIVSDLKINATAGARSKRDERTLSFTALRLLDESLIRAAPDPSIRHHHHHMCCLVARNAERRIIRVITVNLRERKPASERGQVRLMRDDCDANERGDCAILCNIVGNSTRLG